MLRYLFWLSLLASGVGQASEGALFMTVHNYTTKPAVLTAASPNMHSLVGEETLAPGEVFIAKFDHSEHIKPYLLYKLQNKQTQGQCYLQARNNPLKLTCTGPFLAEQIYLGENSYEFSLYDNIKSF
ncbi:MAG: hypothetical protein K0S11_525 [Gammaproteobacteria bacterium]|jgi:hypothetical protein|nr:hypothetical protein [Gammaproteobacteria bacterium]